MSPANQKAAQPRPSSRILSTLAAVGAALGVVTFHTPPRQLLSAPFIALVERDSAAGLLGTAEAGGEAFGRSGGVKVRFALPSDTLTYPLDVRGDQTTLAYQWVRLEDASRAAGAPRQLIGDLLVSPADPGFYRLALVRGGERRLVEGPTLAVKVPFARKLGAVLNGYRIGTYLAERLGRGHDRPDGFVEVDADHVDMPLSKHFRLGDFLTHDSQETWPRYAALDPKLLDKLELVIAEIARVHGRDPNVAVNVEVSSGFRTPLYNRRVRWAAGDSRHQYGDAADVTIDANFDGRYTAFDSRLVSGVGRAPGKIPPLAPASNRPGELFERGRVPCGTAPSLHIGPPSPRPCPTTCATASFASSTGCPTSGSTRSSTTSSSCTRSTPSGRLRPRRPTRFSDSRRPSRTRCARGGCRRRRSPRR